MPHEGGLFSTPAFTIPRPRTNSQSENRSSREIPVNGYSRAVDNVYSQVSKPVKQPRPDFSQGYGQVHNDGGKLVSPNDPHDLYSVVRKPPQVLPPLQQEDGDYGRLRYHRAMSSAAADTYDRLGRSYSSEGIGY